MSKKSMLQITGTVLVLALTVLLTTGGLPYCRDDADSWGSEEGSLAPPFEVIPGFSPESLSLVSWILLPPEIPWTGHLFAETAHSRAPPV